eukprot:CAMPEP_0184712138 /NCGR_PEP_ID=MMETSP0314-20130426/2734_1 /TAXON_ID=38298 /ORGANISM="Rhodella maculata, Strain CCMP 736" /LENGTH=222 /DNA_ID=CAMNT_0027174507 /DNA_START=55 /DNA_END=723 /DNA_ORIENTATION=-
MKGHGGTGNIIEDVGKAIQIVQAWNNPSTKPEAIVPKEVLQNCYGLVFLNFFKIGAVFSSCVGSGFVLTKLDKGTKNEHWSAPSAITSGAFGIGIQVGAEMGHSVFTLNTEHAKKAFYSNGKLKIGTDLEVAAGPMGRRLETSNDVNEIFSTPICSYTFSDGAIIGASLEGNVILQNPEVNKAMYGKELTAEQLLSGAEDDAHVKHVILMELYQELDKAMAI